MKGTFYLESSAWSKRAVLAGGEAQHARVLRLKPDDTVRLLDGKGKTGQGRVLRLTRTGLELEILVETLAPPPPSFTIIALALSKAVRRGFFMEKASELGAGAVWLWQALRSQGHLSQNLLNNLEGQLVAGMKQSGNPWLPELRAFNSIQRVIDAAQDCACKYLPYESEDAANMLVPAMLGRPGRVIFIIGPEGGIDPQELDCLEKAGFIRVSLGERVLRCETAATLCLGLNYWASQLNQNGAPQ